MLSKTKSSYKLLLDNADNIEAAISKGLFLIKSNPNVVSNEEYVLNNTFGFKYLPEEKLLSVLYHVYNGNLLGFAFNTEKNKIDIIIYGISNEFIAPLKIFPKDEYFFEYLDGRIGIASYQQPIRSVALFLEEEVDYIDKSSDSIVKGLLSFDSFVRDYLVTDK